MGCKHLLLSILQGPFKNYAENTAKVLSLPQGLQAYITRKIDYCQLFMHVIIDFNAAIAKLRLLRQR